MKKILTAIAAAMFMSYSMSAVDREHTLKVYNWANRRENL